MSLWTRMWAASNPTVFDPGGILSGMVGYSTASGVRVSADSALKLSTVFACVRLLSETIASLPLVVYQRQADGGRAEATNHPLYDLLHTLPNGTQTAIEFRQMMTAHALLRGNAYARIVPGARGFADQLIPLHPDRVMPEELPDGNLRYRVNGLGILNDDQVLHLKGLSLDGKTGVSVVTYARESMGLNLAAEAYGARFFGNGATPGGVLKKPDGKKLSDPAALRLKASWEAAHTGANQHRVAVLEEGLEWQSIGLNNKDSQFLELLDHQAEDECRWFGVPPHMVGLTSKVTSWGSGIEQMSIGFVTYTLLPWLKRWEQAISRDLILAPQLYFVEHVVAGLLRGDQQARYAAYSIALDKGIYSINEVRQKENENPIVGGDQHRVQLNTADINTPGAMRLSDNQRAAVGARIGPGDWPNLPGEHYNALLHEAAGRVVRKEIAAMTKAYGRLKRHSDWAAVVQEFYSDHTLFVAQTLRIDIETARRYVTEQMAELETGPEAMADWETRRVADLVKLVLEESHDD